MRKLLSVSERHLVCQLLSSAAVVWAHFCSSKETVLKLLPHGENRRRRFNFARRHKYFRLALDYLEENGSVFLELETKLRFCCVKLDLFVCVSGEECHA